MHFRPVGAKWGLQAHEDMSRIPTISAGDRGRRCHRQPNPRREIGGAFQDETHTIGWPGDKDLSIRCLDGDWTVEELRDDGGIIAAG